jgi:hypothetical protein
MILEIHTDHNIQDGLLPNITNCDLQTIGLLHLQAFVYYWVDDAVILCSWLLVSL